MIDTEGLQNCRAFSHL